LVENIQEATLYLPEALYNTSLLTGAAGEKQKVCFMFP
jgi:hypothetical protein